MAMSEHITRWNCLALIIIVVGGALSWGGGWFVLHQWAESGVKIPVGEWQAVDLERGEMLVYYESPAGLPGRHTMFSVRGPSGELISANQIRRRSRESRGRISDVSFEDQFLLTVSEAGPHEIYLFNSRFDPDDVPEDDRVALAKWPPTIDDAMMLQRAVLLTGAGLSVGLAAVCYVLHVRSRMRRRLITAADASA